MRQKFEFDGDGVELLLTSASGDLLRVPLGTLLAMTTLNDGELVRFSHQPPPTDPYDAAAPLPPRRHVRVMVEETPIPEQVDAVALVQEDSTIWTLIADPTIGHTARLITDRPDGPVGRRVFPAQPAIPSTPTGTPVREEYDGG